MHQYTRAVVYGDPTDISVNYALNGLVELAYQEYGVRVSVRDILNTEGMPEESIVPLGGIDAVRMHHYERDISSRCLELPPVLPNRYVAELETAKQISRTRSIFVKSLVTKQMDPEVWGPDSDPCDIDLATMHLEDDWKVVIDEPIHNILSEFRGMVVNGELVAFRHYGGDPLEFPDPRIVKNTICALEAHHTDEGKWAPSAYSADFMVFADANQARVTRLVEVNDSWALGEYGTFPYIYARMVRARWLQLLKEKR